MKCPDCNGKEPLCAKCLAAVEHIKQILLDAFEAAMARKKKATES